MKTKLFAVALLAGGALFAQPRVQIGIGVGGYAPAPYAPAYAPPYAEQVMPPCPGPDYSWVDGYWSPVAGRRTWIAGYWARRPYATYRERDFRYDRDFRSDRDYRNNRERDEHRHYGNGFRDGRR